MKFSNQAVLTESSILVLSKGVFQTSIPLRRWSTQDGMLWSGSLRQGHQIEWLIANLNESLNELTSESLMQRVLRVLADSNMPPRLPLISKKPVKDTTKSDEPTSASSPPTVPRTKRSVPHTRPTPHAQVRQSFVAPSLSIVA